MKCWHTSSQDAHHPGPIVMADGRPYCPEHLRLHEKIKARREHHADTTWATPGAPVKLERCFAHDRSDRLSCPECIENRRDRANV